MIGRCVLALALLTVPCGAQSVRLAQWGFDGAVVPGRFNLLTVLVENPGDEPLDTDLIVTRRTTLGGQLGAPIVEPIYLAPRSSRWVQITPYVTSRRQPWNVRFAREELAGMDVPRPAAGDPALVLLSDMSAKTALSYLIPVYPESRFPTSLAATEGLGAVVMDRAPEWEEARRRTFVDWVRGGGTVHLLQGFRGWPTFTDELEALNGEGRVVRVGAGRVVKHEFTRSELQRLIPEELRVDAPEFVEEIESVVTERLRSQVEVTRYWGFINLLAFLYVGLVGLGVFRVAQVTGGDWRRTLGTLAAVIVVASIAFTFAGARGVGERSILHSLTLARPLDDGRWNTIRYANAFVTRGGEYEIEADGEDDAFTTAQVHEPVAGRITEGREAALTVELPQYSWRSFVHQRVSSAPPVRLRAVDGPWRRGGGLPRFVLESDAGATIGRPVCGLCAWKDSLTPFRFDGRRTLPHGQVFGFPDFSDAFLRLEGVRIGWRGGDARALLDAAAQLAADRTVADEGGDRAVVWVLAEPGEAFARPIQGFGEHRALALFRFDLFVGEEGR